MGMANFENKAVFATPKTKVEGKNDSFNFSLLLIFALAIFILFVSWNLFSDLWILKSIVIGQLLVYYSWELIYFDCLRPGFEPPSPISPPHIRITSSYTLHFNYALATFIGITLSLFIGYFM